jgi:hypothetical protein
MFAYLKPYLLYELQGNDEEQNMWNTEQEILLKN